jgi:hypothetical protein
MMMPKVLRWLKINFSPLLAPRYNCKQQEHINTSRVEMASMAMIHFGLDPGKFLRFLGGEYTGYTCTVHRTLSVVKDHVSPEDTLCNELTKQPLFQDLDLFMIGPFLIQHDVPYQQDELRLNLEERTMSQLRVRLLENSVIKGRR